MLWSLIFNTFATINISTLHFYIYINTPSDNTPSNTWKDVVGRISRYALEAMVFGGITLLILFFLNQQGTITTVIPLLSFYAFAIYRLRPSLDKVFKAVAKIRFNKSVLDLIYKEFNRLEGPEERGLARSKLILPVSMILLRVT